MNELQRLRMMMLIRAFEQRCFRDYTMPYSLIGGFQHLSSGQEALAVGVAAVFRRGIDYFINGFRCHGYSLALGMSARAAMAELFGKMTGCCQGKGGSMHFFDADAGNLGGHHAAGAQIPLGLGAAFACRYRHSGDVCFIAFGDGAMNSGAFHESLNIAALWKLPAVFLLEDNGVAMGTRVERSSAEPDLAKRVEAYAVPVAAVDGNDVDSMVDALTQARDRARDGGGPTFVAAKTYRLRGFSMSDPQKYRTKEEVDRAKLDDPIRRYTERLKSAGLIDDAWVAGTGRELTGIIEDAVQFAGASPDPPPGQRFVHVLAERDKEIPRPSRSPFSGAAPSLPLSSEGRIGE
jgi:pyruvate dehydrogenase E1 component alpha subunit